MATDDEIDKLGCRELDAAVAESLGWTNITRTTFREWAGVPPTSSQLHHALHNWSTDNGLAVGLLLGKSLTITGDDTVGYCVSALLDCDNPDTLVEALGETFAVAASRCFIKINNKAAP